MRKGHFQERFRERMLDARDWVDIRPEPHWWPYAAVPAAVGFAYFEMPKELLPIFLLVAFAAAVAITFAGFVFGFGLVVFRAVSDVIQTPRTETRRAIVPSRATRFSA